MSDHELDSVCPAYRALLKKDLSVFVFGSNLAGQHVVGAAAVATRYFGAARGISQGWVGRSYAIPTKSESLRTLALREIAWYAHTLIDIAASHLQHRFVLTRIGCGLAGYNDFQIAPLFLGATKNVILPWGWSSISSGFVDHESVEFEPLVTAMRTANLRVVTSDDRRALVYDDLQSTDAIVDVGSRSSLSVESCRDLPAVQHRDLTLDTKFQREATTDPVKFLALLWAKYGPRLRDFKSSDVLPAITAVDAIVWRLPWQAPRDSR